LSGLPPNLLQFFSPYAQSSIGSSSPSPSPNSHLQQAHIKTEASSAAAAAALSALMDPLGQLSKSAQAQLTQNFLIPSENKTPDN
jgi:hypothetical protein